MYSLAIADRRIEAEIQRTGLNLVRHTPRQCERVTEMLEEIYDREEMKLTRPLKPTEKAWIKNEKLVCRSDFRYWASRYAMIKDKENNLVHFIPNVAQNIVLDIWGELEELGREIAIQELKARQLGVSTLTELAVAHRVQFYTYRNGVVASSDPDKSAEMAQMMELCWAKQPWWLVPRMTSYRAGILVEFGDIGSRVSIQHGTQFSGIARGSTPTIAHLSELADYENAEEIVDASLLRAMHPSPWIFLVLESTANGIGNDNWWYRTWQSSKEGYDQGRSRLKPVFLPWFVGTDIYPTVTDIKTRFHPESYVPSDMVIKHAEKAKEYVHASPLLSKYLGSDWTMPIEQMWWYDTTREEYRAKQQLPQFLQECPANDLEAFQSTNISIFDPETIQLYRDNVTMPQAVLAFRGRPFPETFQPSVRAIDDRFPRIPISRRLPDDSKFECELVPLKFHGYPGYDFSNKLFVWHMPEQGQVYAEGYDTGDGVAKDRTACEVIAKANPSRPLDLQAAEFASSYVNAYDMVPIAFAIHCLYEDVSGRQPKVVVECNRNGESLQLELRKMGVTHFHDWVRYDNKRIRPTGKKGWYTNAWSRPMIMDLITKAIRDEWLEINSPWFVHEMQTLETSWDAQDARAVYGEHDDRIMAMAFALFSLHVLELRGTQRGLIHDRVTGSGGGGNSGPAMYHPGFQAAATTYSAARPRTFIRGF